MASKKTVYEFEKSSDEEIVFVNSNTINSRKTVLSNKSDSCQASKKKKTEETSNKQFVLNKKNETQDEDQTLNEFNLPLNEAENIQNNDQVDFQNEISETNDFITNDFIERFHNASFEEIGDSSSDKRFFFKIN